jgi:hypothetical protein
VTKFLCENLCEKYFPKSAKIGKNREKCGKSYLTNSEAYNNMRTLGTGGAVAENLCVASQAHSILSFGTIRKEVKRFG